MGRIGRAALILVPLLAATPSPVARSDDEPNSDVRAVDDVGRVLAEWHARALKITSVEARYRHIVQSKEWGSTRTEGQLVMAAPDLAMIETFTTDATGKTTGLIDRSIWNGGSVLLFDMSGDTVNRLPLPKSWDALPSLLRLPFFFRMTVEEARRDYAWEIVRENRDQILLRVTPTPAMSRSVGFKSGLIELDPSTYRPRRLITTDLMGDGRQTYEAIEIKVNSVHEVDHLKAPCLDAWNVTEVNGWPANLMLKHFGVR